MYSSVQRINSAAVSKGIGNSLTCSHYFVQDVFITSLHSLPILLVKLGFRLSKLWFFMLLFLWFLVFIFSVLCFEFNVISNT